MHDMTLVEGGYFAFGRREGHPVQNDRASVLMNDFLIGAYPVTQREWKTVIGSNPSCFKGPNLPVEQISWLDAVAFCNALSKRESLPCCYSRDGPALACDFSAAGYRLPTEAEWEFAATGGRRSQGYLYSGGDDPSAVAWFLGNSFKKTHEVGKKLPNELGLYDMSGNVYEWCWDWYREYGEADAEAFKPTPSSRRVVRGGNCTVSSYRIRSAERWSGHPEYGYDLVGMRLARGV